jgi:high-affinity iron transporter
VFSNYLIGLREGLEAAIVVGILVAYLVKTDRRDKLPAIWIGVGLAIGVSLAFGAILTYGSSSMSFEAQEAFGGFMSILAVSFVTWMIFWMRKAARSMKGELHGKIDAAMALGPVALAVTAAIAVGREGLETALFLWTNIQATGSSAQPITGAVLGLATAVVLGYLIYRRAVAINLARFFTITGALLIVVAAGVLAYGVHDLQEAGILPGLNNTAFDISSWYSASSWYGTLLKGLFNFSPNPTVLEVVVWFAYLVPVMILFIRGVRAPDPTPAPATTVTEGGVVAAASTSTPSTVTAS